MIRYIFLFLPLMASAQADSRWRLILPDSVVQLPLADLRTAAVYRLTCDMRFGAAVQEIVALSGEVASLRDAVDQQRLAADAAKAAALLCDEDRTDMITACERWQRKAQRRGRVVGVLCAVVVGFTLATLAQ